MSLAPSEQQILAEIENRLRRSDPGLAARLALFSRRAARRKGPVRERLSPWRAGHRHLMRIVVVAATAVAAIVSIVLLARGSPGRGPAGVIPMTRAAWCPAQPAGCSPGGKAPSAAAGARIPGRLAPIRRAATTAAPCAPSRHCPSGPASPRRPQAVGRR
jgi:hypothetical protein